MSDSAKSLLAEHVACREAWLAATESVLVTDHRVEAVILYGSFGRDDVDEWSDVDMIVIISDANLPSESTASSYRTGRTTPHQLHWIKLRDLVVQHS
jgi:UTP:GlnB (protein PII) uridylyltransferase